MDIKSLPDNKLRELILTPDHLGVKIKEEALDELLKRSFQSALPTACDCEEARYESEDGYRTAMEVAGF